jgi:hypothetical protein
MDCSYADSGGSRQFNVCEGKITGQAYYFDQEAFLQEVGFFDRC